MATSPWSLLAGALSEKLELAELELHLSRGGLAAEWSDDRLGDWQAWLLADSLPVSQTLYRRRGIQLSQAYFFSFLTNLDIPLVRRPIEELRQLWQRYDDSRHFLNRVLGELLSGNLPLRVDHRELMRAIHLLPPEKRRGINDLGGWLETTLDWIEEAIRDYAQHFRDEVPAAFSEAACAIVDFGNDAYRRAVSAPDGTRFHQPSYIITPDLASWIADCEAGRLRPLSVSVAGEIRAPDGSPMAIEIEAELEGHQLFDIRPGRWFRPLAVLSYADGPWVAGGPVARGVVKLWGADGVLGLQPAHLLAAYRPRILITLSSSGPLIAEREAALAALDLDPRPAHAEIEIATPGRGTRTQVVLEAASDLPWVLAIASRRLP